MNTMVTSDFKPQVEIWPFRACTIIIEAVRLFWNWLWGRYHVPQNVFLVLRNLYVDDRRHEQLAKTIELELKNNL